MSQLMAPLIQIPKRPESSARAGPFEHQKIRPCLRTTLRRRWNASQTLRFRKWKASRHRMARQGLGKSAEQAEAASVDPAVPALEQEGIATLLEKLRHEI